MDTDTKQLIRGSQRTAVYHALKRPITGKQMLHEARKTSPTMSYQDLRHILRDFRQNGTAVCLNPQHQTGRFYVLADEKDNVCISTEELNLCAQVARSSTLLAVLEEVAKERFFETYPLTATQIRKELRDHHPLGLNHVLTALQFLETNGLVETAGRTDKRELKIFRTTESGEAILRFVLGEKNPEPPEGTPTR